MDGQINEDSVGYGVRYGKFFTAQYACRGMFTYFLPYVDHATVVASLRW